MKKNSQQFCAGFGIGDAGLALRRKASGGIIQLAYNTKIKNSKDAFDAFTASKNLDPIITRNSIFNIEIYPGDELLGYTYLCNMEKENKEDSRSLLNPDVVRYSLDSDQVANAQRSLYDQVVERNSSHFAEKCRTVEENYETDFFGSDCMISSIITPSLDLQKKLRHKIYDNPANKKTFCKN